MKPPLNYATLILEETADMIPRDPAILMSYINMKLRNNYRSLRDLCEEEQIDVIELCKLLDKIDYHYDEKQNQFI